MLLDVFAHRFPALEKVFTERIDQRGQFFLAAFPGYVDAFVFPEGGPILVAALPEVSSDKARRGNHGAAELHGRARGHQPLSECLAR